MSEIQNPLAAHLSKYKVILASNSPRRKELLAQLGLEFTVRTLSDVDESFPEGLSNEETACYIARKKAEAHAAQMAADELIITADTIVCSEDRVLGKPTDVAEAKLMLQQLAGHTHQVVTGVAIVTKEKQQEFAVTSDVTFAPLTDSEIDYYVTHYRPLDKAGAYGIQEWIGLVAVEQLRGSFFNVMGLPVQRLYGVLKEF
ncbi:MAG: septum formation protein Maf [Bacteroidaceae bacterium]|nr:septum formation protein Maf [Bacteroidaceae bacterium]